MKAFRKAQEGVTMLQYVILAAILGIGAILAFTPFGQTLGDKMVELGTWISGLPSGG